MPFPGVPTVSVPAVDGDRERVPRVVLGVTAVVAGLLVRDPLAYAAVGIAVLLTPVERLWPRRRGQRVLRRGWATDVLHLLITLAVAGLLTAVPVALARPFVPEITPVATWVAAQPSVVRAVLALVVFDLFGYVAHRLEHEIGFLWRFHRIHHSSEELDWLAGARVHPVSAVLEGTFRAVPALLLGLPRDVAGLLAVVVALTVVLTHANVSWRLPRLSRWWATPEFHHWHHASEPEAIDHNYAGLLPVWDRLFGTFHLPDRHPRRYGADRPVPAGWWGQLLDPFRGSASADTGLVPVPTTTRRGAVRAAEAGETTSSPRH